MSTNACGADNVEWNLRAVEKLHLDFRTWLRRGVVMDDDAFDLAVRLCTRIGMIMEDASPVALTMSGMNGEERQAAMDDLERAICQLGSLIEAAKALHA